MTQRRGLCGDRGASVLWLEPILPVAGEEGEAKALACLGAGDALRAWGLLLGYALAGDKKGDLMLILPASALGRLYFFVGGLGDGGRGEGGEDG